MCEKCLRVIGSIKGQYANEAPHLNDPIKKFCPNQLDEAMTTKFSKRDELISSSDGSRIPLCIN